MNKKVGIAGLGALGSTIARSLLKGEIKGMELTCASDIAPPDNIDVPIVDFDQLAQNCDLIIETLPPKIVPDLIEKTQKYDKDVIVVSSSALLAFPEIIAERKEARLRGKKGRIFVPSGALCGIDGVFALAQMKIKSARIATTKPPRGFAGAPYIVQQNIDLNAIDEKTKIFKGYALDAAKAFPANVNVAATLSIAGVGADKTWVEIWADPAAQGNSHEIEVIGGFSSISAKVSNTPDPANPKSSMITAYSVIALLKNMSEAVVII